MSERTHPTVDAVDAPVQWRIDGFDPEQPFTAALVIEDGDTSAAMALDPATLALLAPALNWVRSAQRAVVLGEPVPQDLTEVADSAPAATSADGAESDAPSDPPKKPMTRGRVVFLTLAALVGACVIYALAVGATLI